jgi:hypothetical protein
MMPSGSRECGRAVLAERGSPCPGSSCPWDLSFPQVATFARQARPQSRPRCFSAHSETKVRPCCPHFNPFGRGGPESFARLFLTRVPLVAMLGLELGILGEKPQALEGAGPIRIPLSIRHLPGPLQPQRRDQLRC